MIISRCCVETKKNAFLTTWSIRSTRAATEDDDDDGDGDQRE